jgi:heptosyltransferase I
VPGAVVLPKLSVTECAHCIDESAIVVGMDTGLVHLAHALGRPTVMIFTATSREHFGFSAPGRSVSVGDHFAPPDVPAVLSAIESVMPGAERSSASPASLIAAGQASS